MRGLRTIRTERARARRSGHLDRLSRTVLSGQAVRRSGSDDLSRLAS